jgi:hypothetical protein
MPPLSARRVQSQSTFAIVLVITETFNPKHAAYRKREISRILFLLHKILLALDFINIERICS